MKQTFNSDVQINRFINRKSLEILNKNISSIKNRKNKFLFEEKIRASKRSLEICKIRFI